jgi:hypothetical protein
MITSSRELEAKELFEQMMRLCNGHTSGSIKSAAVNLLIAAISCRSSNIDEAILQWNELSLNADRLLHERFELTLSESDQFDPTKINFHGG